MWVAGDSKEVKQTLRKGREGQGRDRKRTGSEGRKLQGCDASVVASSENEEWMMAWEKSAERQQRGAEYHKACVNLWQSDESERMVDTV
ncbi:hypothetical protein AXG93_1264s1020 [Marchantia polymorpha subsp. ruderalis]|uniref:Uncharacterized protein n=1 Tax=Marchantia polymorpha subsp. ruderalis TaxID=1480154 RepID=A0A176WLL8_MARPO|nr:hypothetical protein AXG93_1264s1020 [Marchantia polymorpha subsp. ruderalis]